MLALNVRFDLRDEDAARRFDALLDAALPAVRAEAGTRLYLVHTVPRGAGEPPTRLVHAVYDDAAAHAVHNGAPAMAALLAALPELTTAVRVEEVVPTHPDDVPARPAARPTPP
ncbi:putative quinol monooxygenase [Kineococcus gypseus]|uniref:putative quinol monooxygenase n=1 Tax=Kineococcus gypseus TaxID=1637102 RepID=UPI003D7E1FFB